MAVEPYTEADAALVELAERDGLAFAGDAPHPFHLRKTIADRLYRVVDALPPGHRLVLFEAHRTQSRQFRMWNRRFAEIARTHPELGLDALITETRRWVADPVDRPSGHQGGTAVDVTLAVDGQQLDMGTEVGEFSKLTPTAAPGLAPLVVANRARLRALMEAQGFLNYDEEWWHFSYGDRLWAEMRAYGTDTGTISRVAYPFGPITAS
ncbi:MAG: D-alanyl-D-alanine carboxypeptidase family protein [Alphaproteobacteria bacterium]|nr:D-alanyl-D-alanine carboxypeptidase family protein [Alphaproteobacteria bacterium]